MVKTLISVDPKKAPWEQETPLHNRWHPDIPPVASVKEGEKFRECFSISIGHMHDMLADELMLLLLMMMMMMMLILYISLLL